MNIADPIWGLLSFCISVGLGINVEAIGADRTPGPIDWSDWEKHRESVVHPATVIEPQDLVRAKASD